MTTPRHLQPPPSPPQVPEIATRYGRVRGTVTFANDVLTLVGVNLESASGVSQYMASGTVTVDDTPEVNATLEVDNGEIRDILLTLKIFELADFRLNLLQPPGLVPALNPSRSRRAAADAGGRRQRLAAGTNSATGRN